MELYGIMHPLHSDTHHRCYYYYYYYYLNEPSDDDGHDGWHRIHLLVFGFVAHAVKLMLMHLMDAVPMTMLMMTLGKKELGMVR
jgi:hypothetical protein